MRNLLIAVVALWAALARVCANNPIRQVPYPQQEHIIYLNPAPLLVPYAMKQSDFLQFNLSPDRSFKSENTVLSRPVPWCVFNPHQTLSSGIWYWRFRSVSKSGEEMPWSETYSFTVTDDTPRFATPPFSTFMGNVPQEYSRIYCFLNSNLEQARRQVRSHPEFEYMIDDARDALAMNFANDTKPYNQISQIAANCDKLNTAYQMMQQDTYADKMVKNVRCLLAAASDPKVIANDFSAGELVYIMACTYESCFDRFTAQEQKQMETIIMNTISQYYNDRILGREENMFFDEHFWQFTFRHFLQGALVLHDKYPLAKEYLEYSYELWTSRAPASGFNRDGSWHNGTNYFSANAISLAYVATLFSHLTGTDFLQHPWYKNAGPGVAYCWQPGSLSSGFGDGHENTNSKPLRIRSAFADFIARNTGDPYATWYSALNDRYKSESETRLYRMASGKQRPAQAQLPADAPKAAWFKDCGEMIANSDLKNLKKNISLSFHSSPFGSGNHTHSNQNAFNLHYGGEAVYRAVGHYMKFDDRHNLLSYRNTRAYNTLLVDGIGQPFTQRANGYIVRMFNGEHIAYALGDASNAYCGISEINYWKKAFASHNLEQSPENGFGETSLKKYRRHILQLYPNIVIIYDELEAGKAVRWDWLLHSPVKFGIDGATSTLVTENKGFRSVARLFSEQPCNIAQTDQFAAAPNQKNAERGEDFTKPWSLTAGFGPSKKNRILTIIQVEADGSRAVEIIRTDSRFACGDWIIEAELNAERPASLHIGNSRSKATFSYGKKRIMLNGQEYQCSKADASVLYDRIGGEWKTEEMSDRQVQTMGKW